MDKRRIGSLEVTVVGLGTNNFGSRLNTERTADVVAATLDSGINFFDTADVYGNTLSEVYLGAALGDRRDEAIIATKFGGWRLNPDEAAGASPRRIATAVEDSLRRLDTDRIDLYQLHVPDPDTPIEDTLVALDRLVQAGKVREIGCSNFEASDIDGSMDISDTRGLAAWSSVQNRYSMLHRTPETDRVLDACSRHGIALLPYFPLESGLLTGKYQAGAAPPEGTRLAEYAPEDRARFFSKGKLRAMEALRDFSQQRGRTLIELAFCWLLSRPEVASVIAGATKPEQVATNSASAGWVLTEDELAEIGAILVAEANQPT